jgi:hypothetical protein
VVIPCANPVARAGLGYRALAASDGSRQQIFCSDNLGLTKFISHQPFDE